MSNALALPNEVFKDIEGYEGLYQVSNFGRVKSLARDVQHYRTKERILANKVSHNGYEFVCLCIDKAKTNHRINRLVAQAFLDNPEGKEQVNHINGVKNDNRVENLEWSTSFENMQHATKFLSRHGQRIGMSKLRDDDIVDIRTLLGYGVKQAVVAELFGVAKVTINHIHRGRTWGFV